MSVSPVTWATVTGVVVVAGTWADPKKSLTPRVGVGTVIYGLALSVLWQVNEKFASLFAALVLVGAIFAYGYGQSISKAVRGVVG